MRKIIAVAAVCLLLVTAGCLGLVFDDNGNGAGENGTIDEDVTPEDILSDAEENMLILNSYEVETEFDMSGEFEGQNETMRFTSEGQFYENANEHRIESTVEKDSEDDFGEQYYFNDTIYSYLTDSGEWSPTEADDVEVGIFDGLFVQESNTEYYDHDIDETNNSHVFTVEDSNLADEKATQVIQSTLVDEEEIIPDDSVLKADSLSSIEAHNATYEVIVDDSTREITDVKMDGEIESEGEQFNTTASLRFIDTDIDSLAIPDEVEDGSLTVEIYEAELLDGEIDSEGNVDITITETVDVLDSIKLESELETHQLTPDEGESITLEPGQDYDDSEPHVRIYGEFESGSTTSLGLIGLPE